jgi:hypothetical protein
LTNDKTQLLTLWRPRQVLEAPAEALTITRANE